MKTCMATDSNHNRTGGQRYPTHNSLRFASRYIGLSVMSVGLLAWSGAAKADYLSTVKSYGAIAYYAFSETAGSTSFSDSITGGGTHVSALVTSGDSAYVTAGASSLPGLGSSVQLSGTTSNRNVLSIASGSVIDSSSVLSYDFWVKQTSTFGRNEILSNSGDWAEEVFTDTNGTSVYRIFANQEGGYTSLAANTFALNTWHNVAATKTAGGVETLYIDGNQINSGTHTQNWFQSQLYIGASNGSGFNGNIAGLGFFNTTLTSSQINNLMTVANENTAATPEPGSAALLFSLGVVGVGFLRRHRK